MNREIFIRKSLTVRTPVVLLSPLNCKSTVKRGKVQGSPNGDKARRSEDRMFSSRHTNLRLPQRKFAMLTFLLVMILVLLDCVCLASAREGKRSCDRPLPFKHVITNIAVEPIRKGTKLRPNTRVQFHAHTKGGHTAYALTNVVETDQKFRGRHPIYQATIVDSNKLQSQIDAESPDKLDWIVPFRHRKTLLCVHGFNTQPQDWFRECSKYNKHGQSTIVPVIWPGTKYLACFCDVLLLANRTLVSHTPLVCIGRRQKPVTRAFVAT